VAAVDTVTDGYFVLYPPAQRLKSGYISVLPVSVTVPADGDSTAGFALCWAAPAAFAPTSDPAKPTATTVIAAATKRARRVERIKGPPLEVVAVDWVAV
jgi:hypothetical protein